MERRLTDTRGPHWLAGSFLVLGLCAFLCTSAHAQKLPDIGQLDVEKVRLILLGKEGRVGMLEGARARKFADGKVRIDDAKLTLEAGEGAFELEAKEFSYAPDTGAFECPHGAKATLPGKDEMTIPPVTGTIVLGDTTEMDMQSTGNARIKSALLTAEMTDPTVALSLKRVAVKDAQGKESTVLLIRNLLIQSPHGAQMSVRLERLPSPQGQPEAGGVVSLSCFGDASLRVQDAEPATEPPTRRASLSMLRRASMTLHRETQTFSVTSGYLEIRGKVVRAPDDDKEQGQLAGNTALADIEMDARQNVRIELKNDSDARNERDFRGSGDLLKYREFPERTELRIETNAALELDRGQAPDGALLKLRLQAAQFLDVVAPRISGSIQQATMELSDHARVQRLRDGRPDWQVIGRQVRVFSWQDSPGSYSHSFDAVAEGFSPLLRVFSLPAAATEGFEVQRASVYGARAEGTLVGDRAEARVDGLETMAIVAADFPLAAKIRGALGLANRDKVDKRDGRMTVRAARTLEVGINAGEGASGDLRVAADGAVTLDYEPQPRDDSAMVTLTGDYAALEWREGELRSADLAGADALATLGYDLLTAQGLTLRENDGTLITDVAGPGRLVARDEGSVRYFQDVLGSLPRRDGPVREMPDPDAGWLAFGGDCRLVSRREPEKFEARTFEIGAPVAHLVYGDFEQPRAGRASVNDLPELTLPEVFKLYFISGHRAVLHTTRSLQPRDDKRGEKMPSVNVLRLEGDAVVRSELGGVYAAASDAIEITGANEQAGGQNPFTGVLLGKSELTITRAGEFFGDDVRGGAFGYDGRWVLHATDRLELTMRPVDAAFAGEGFKSVQELLARAISDDLSVPLRLAVADGARNALRKAVGESLATAAPAAEVAQPQRALLAMEEACRSLAAAAAMSAADPKREWRINGGMAALRMADRLLGVLIDVSGRGGLNGEFHSSKEQTPRLDLAMQNLLVTFNQLGEVLALEAEGPIELRRSDYALRGNKLLRGPDGTLKLDGAELTLPEATGIEVAGVKSISLRQTQAGVAPDGTVQPSRMVTRISGAGMKLRVKLAE